MGDNHAVEKHEGAEGIITDDDSGGVSVVVVIGAGRGHRTELYLRVREVVRVDGHPKHEGLHGKCREDTCVKSCEEACTRKDFPPWARLRRHEREQWRNKNWEGTCYLSPQYSSAPAQGRGIEEISIWELVFGPRYQRPLESPLRSRLQKFPDCPRIGISRLHFRPTAGDALTKVTLKLRSAFTRWSRESFWTEQQASTCMHVSARIGFDRVVPGLSSFAQRTFFYIDRVSSCEYLT
jgi:hypothetical protein